MLTFLACLAIILIGVTWGYWAQIVAWFRGGEPQITVKPENRGLARHSIAYIAAHGGTVIRPLAYRNRIYWRVGGRTATIREA